MTEVCDRILEISEKLFKTYGIRNVTMDQISGELGMSKKTIYQFFPDKGVLVMEVCKVSLEKEHCVFEELTGASLSAIDELVNTSRHFRNMLREVNPLLFHDMQKFYPKAWNLYLNFKNDQLKQNLITVMKKGIEEGIFRATIDVNILAIMRMEQIEMGFSQEIFPASQYTASDVQMELLHHFIFGIVTFKGHELIINHPEFSKD